MEAEMGNPVAEELHAAGAAADIAPTETAVGPDIATLVRAAVEEALSAERSGRSQLEEALAAERSKREDIETQIKTLASESARLKQQAETAERWGVIRAELSKLGVSKVDLAFRAVRDDIVRREDGELVAASGSSLAEYLRRFVDDNPELLPPRISGGAGTSGSHQGISGTQRVDLNRIRPGMSAEELERARQEIARLASQTFRGQ